MENYPKISIVTVSFNQGDFLERTILSVLNQNYPNLEYIIIDGGSTDGSIEVIKKYQDKLAFWISEKDNGMYDALQKGFSRTTGEVMCWLNSDDMLHPGSFKTISKVFAAHEDVEWIQGMPTVFDDGDLTIKVSNNRAWTKLNFFTASDEYIQQESTFWKRSLWDRAGATISQDYKLAGDYELWARFFRYAPLYVIETILGGFRFRGTNQLSIDRIEEYRDEMNAVKIKYLEYFSHEEKNLYNNYIQPSTSYFKRKENWKISQEVNLGHILRYNAHSKNYTKHRFCHLK